MNENVYKLIIQIISHENFQYANRHELKAITDAARNLAKGQATHDDLEKLTIVQFNEVSGYRVPRLTAK